SISLESPSIRSSSRRQSPARSSMMRNMRGESTSVRVARIPGNSDRREPGVYVQRTKFPPGTKVMPHWHPDEWRTAVVLSGTLYFGIGEQWDESKLKAYPTGTFYSEPPKTPHYVWAKDGEVIIQTTGMGPTGTTPIPQN